MKKKISGLGKIIVNTALLSGALLASSLMPLSCGGGSGGVVSNRAPIINAINDRSVDEGGSLIINLSNYVTDPDGDAVVIRSSGVGGVNDGIFSYHDVRDADKNNNSHVVSVEAEDSVGNISRSEFRITQNDLFSLTHPEFFNDRVNWISYSPTNFDPDMKVFPSEQSVRDDLKTLVNANFKGLITYGSDNILGSVPRIAKEEGFKYVVMGVWNFDNLEEWDNALSAKGVVDAYCVGNEGLSGGRYSLKDLESKISELKVLTEKPVTTTEPSGEYDSELSSVGDWLFPNAHPYWSGIADPKEAAAWTVQKISEFESLASGDGKFVVLKEVGLPSGGDVGMGEENQRDYYLTLEKLTSDSKRVSWAYFEAFDQLWKDWADVEPHWGILNSDRSLKEVSKPHIIHTSWSGGNIYGKVLNVLPNDYRISTYINVRGTWWMKPYWDNPLTSIKADGTWGTDITTGGVDSEASRVHSSLVTPDYVPVYHTLPSISDSKVLTNTQTIK